MEKIAITGCASRFARVLLPMLEADPQIERIVGLDRAAPDQAYTKLLFHESDVRDGQMENLLAGCDTLIHLAFIVGRPFRMPLHEAADINLRGTWNVCRAAAIAGVRKLIVGSSIAAYGNLPDNPVPLVEDSPLRGLYTPFYYNQHKHANEIWLDGLQLQYPDLIITRARPCIVIGPNQIAAQTMIHPNRSYITSAPAANTQTQLIHENDLAAAFHAMIQHDLPGAYNVVGDEPDTMPRIATAAGLQVINVPHDALVQQVTDAWHAGTSTIGPDWLGGEGESLICSNAKLKHTGTWTPRYTTVEAYAATVAAVG